jgi:hypothetical protein
VEEEAEDLEQAVAEEEEEEEAEEDEEDEDDGDVRGGAAGGEADDRRSSHVVGVSWKKRVRKWQASKRVGGKIKYLGYHLTEEAAAQAIDNYVRAGAYTRPPSGSTYALSVGKGAHVGVIQGLYRGWIQGGRG